MSNNPAPKCSCIVCRKEYSTKGIHSHYLINHTDEETKAKMIGNGNRKQNNDTQKQQRLNRIEQYNLNPKLCKQCHTTITYDNRGYNFCSHSCSAIFTNALKDYTKIKLGPPKGYKKGIVSQTNTPALGPHTKIQFCSCVICNAQFIRNSITKGSTRHCANPNCFKQFRNICLKGKTGGFRKNSTRKTRSVYKGYQMDSGAELAFAQLLDKHNIKWVKNSTTWFEYLPGKKYYPDFFLSEYNQWIEIKGKYYLREDDNLRWQSVPGLEVIWSNNIELPAVCTGFEPV